MRANLKQKMYRDIHQHGVNLLNIFTNSTIQDPDKLCKKLHFYERKLEVIAVDLCNGDIDQDTADSEADRILSKVHEYLGSDRIWFNRDPRGYALKVDLNPNEKLYSDWGGYGIIAPDFTPTEGI